MKWNKTKKLVKSARTIAQETDRDCENSRSTLLAAADVLLVMGCWVSCGCACTRVSIGWLVWCGVDAFCTSRSVTPITTVLLILSLAKFTLTVKLSMKINSVGIINALNWKHRALFVYCIEWCCPTYGPRAACGPRTDSVRPAKDNKKVQKL